MIYELSHLRQLIDILLHKKAVESYDAAKLEMDIKNESLRILASIQHNTLCLAFESGKSYLIHHQKSLCVMLHELQKESDCAASFATAVQHIDDLLSELECLFPFYFDYHMPVSLNRLKKTEKTLNNNVNKFAEILATSALEMSTLNSLKMLFSELLTNKRNISYHQAIYLEVFSEAITIDILLVGKTIRITDIILIIVSHNFNHPAFYHFCCTYFNSEMDKCENMMDQYQLLNFYKKTVQQVFEVSALSYHTGLPPINEALLRYLEAELDYLKSMETKAEDLSSDGILDQNFKVNLTVRQLAIFIHLQVEAGIINVKSPKALHQYVTRHYSTADRDKISEKSFKNAYYGNAAKDIVKVIDKLAIMLALAQEKY